MNRIRRALHHTLQHLHLWQPATPHVRTWDADMNYLATLQHAQPAHYTWPWRRRSSARQRAHVHTMLGNAHIIVTVDFGQAGHDKLRAARNHIATIATPQPNTPYCTCHTPTLIATNDLNCQLCGGLRPPDVC